MGLEVTHDRPASEDHEAPVVRASSLNPSVARDLLVRRIARLAFLIDLGSPEIIIRNERRLVGEALIALVTEEKPDVRPELPEPSGARRSGRNHPRKQPATWSAFHKDAVRSGPPAGSTVSANGEYR